jgi:hypothetical protein
LRKLLTNPLVYAAVLTGVVLVCYGRTLGSYFLADDFGEVAYVSKIFEGDWQRLWSNFTGNYMQVPSMAVYRPWLLMTLFFDYAIWKTNATGYYFTNLLHYLACTLLIFTLIKLLTSYWRKLRSNLAATFAGAIFAAHPLHCESVSWVVGRVDIVCLTYYLLGLVSVALYVRGLNKRWLILTFASFWLGILTKEMAIGLPVTATALAFLWGNTRGLTYSGSGEPSSTKTISTQSGGNDLNFDPSVVANKPIPSPPDPSTEPSRASAIAALQKLDQELEPQPQTPALPLADGVPVPAAQSGSLPTDGKAVSPNKSTYDSETPISFKHDLRDRMKVALPVAIMLLGCTVVYFIIRYASLGTITGGYTGSIGSSQFSGIIQKWTDLDTVLRIVFPLNQFVFGDGSSQKNLLSAIYLLLIALATTRLVIGSLPRRWLAFIFISSLTALAPIYQLWGIGYDLEGSRFVFFLTSALAMLFPILLFSPLQRLKPTQELVTEQTQPNSNNPATTPNEFKSTQNANLKLIVLSIIALTSLTAIFVRLTLRNNIPWVHAGKQTESIHEKAIALSRSTPNGKLVGVVGIPKDEGGAHMILNGTTFRHLITPPFADPGLTGKILTFEPVLFGDPEKIDTAHFKQALAKNNVDAFLVWNMEKKDFVKFDPGTPSAVPRIIPVPLIKTRVERYSANDSKPGDDKTKTIADGTVSNAVASYPYTRGRGDVNANGLIENAERGFGLRISGLNLHPAQFDYIVVRGSVPTKLNDESVFPTDLCKVQLESKTGETKPIEVRFDTQTSNSPDGKTVVELRLPVSAYWRFFSAGEIAAIVIDLPPVRKLTVDAVELAPAAAIAPSVKVVDRVSADDGAFNVDRRKKKKTQSTNTAPVLISVDATRIAGVTGIELQILKQNFFFDNLKSEAARKAGTQTVLHSVGNKTTFEIPDEIVGASGYTQLRVCGVDSKNKQIGEYSFPTTLRVMASPEK